jgi:Na+/melibiose symporter-like transporter
MKFSFQRLLYNLCTMFLPYLAVAILSVAVTENRHPAFWYLHAAISGVLLLLAVLTSFQRVKERK